MTHQEDLLHVPVDGRFVKPESGDGIETVAAVAGHLPRKVDLFATRTWNQEQRNLRPYKLGLVNYF